MFLKYLAIAFCIILPVCSGDVFFSTGHRSDLLDKQATGDVDYIKIIADTVKQQGLNARLIQGVYTERDIYQRILTDSSLPCKILHIFINAPHTGMIFTPEGLAGFRSHGGHIVATVVEFAKHLNRHNSQSLVEDTYTRLQAAESVIFLDEYDHKAALRNLKGKPYKTLDSLIRCAKTLYVPPTVPVIKMPLSQRGNNILVFGMIRAGKGFAHVLKLAKLMNADPSMAGMKVLIVGTALDHDNGTELFKIVSDMYPDQFDSSIDWTVPSIKKTLEDIKAQNIPSVLPIELHLDVPQDELSTLFERCTYVYNPSYRGMTLRNSSMSSALANGFVLLSHVGDITPDCLKPGGEFDQSVVLSSGDSYHSYANWVFDQIKLRMNTPDLNESTSRSALVITERYLDLDMIAQKHADIYHQVVTMGSAARAIQRKWRTTRAYNHTTYFLGVDLFSDGLKRKNYVPLGELTPQEQELYRILFAFPWTLKHATSNYKVIRDKGGNCLRSVKDRQRTSPEIASDHTTSSLGLDDYVYFTLGSPNHKIAGFLENSAAAVIRVKLEDLDPSQLPYLLFGHHTYEFVTDKTYRAKFGSVERREEYFISDDKRSLLEILEGSHVTITYTEPDGTKRQRRAEWHEENAVGGNIVPFIAQYAVRELRYLGGDYYQYVLSNLDNPVVIENFVDTLFHSHGFEARFPCRFDLSSPKITVESIPSQKTPFLPDHKRLFQAIKSGDLDAVRKLIQQGIDLNVMLKGWCSPLRKAVMCGQEDIALEVVAANGRLIEDQELMRDVFYKKLWRLAQKILTTFYPISSDGKITKSLDIQSKGMFCQLDMFLNKEVNEPGVLQYLYLAGARLTQNILVDDVLLSYEGEHPLLNDLKQLYPEVFAAKLDLECFSQKLIWHCSSVNATDLKRAQKLIDLGADVNHPVSRFPRKRARNNSPLLFQALSEKNYALFNLLVNAGADLMGTNPYGQNLLDVVCEQCSAQPNNDELMQIRTLLEKQIMPTEPAKIRKFDSYDYQIYLLIQAQDKNAQPHILLGRRIIQDVIQDYSDIPFWDTNDSNYWDISSTLSDLISQGLLSHYGLKIKPEELGILYHHDILDTPLPQTQRDKYIFELTRKHSVILINATLPGLGLPQVTANKRMSGLKWVATSKIGGVDLSPESILFTSWGNQISDGDKLGWSTYFERKFEDGNLFHNAVINGEMSKLEGLIQGGHDINALSSLGLTPLVLAVRESRYDMVDLLLRNGASINKWTLTKDYCYVPLCINVTPFLMAIYMDNLDLAQKLYILGGDVNPPNAGLERFGTALKFAHENGNIQIADWLISIKANLSGEGLIKLISETETPQQYEILGKIIDRVCKLDPNDTEIASILFSCIYSWHNETKFRFLISKGVNPVIQKDPDSPNAIELAQEMNKGWALDILKEFGYLPN